MSEKVRSYQGSSNFRVLKLFSGIRNTTTVFETGLDRVRLPRQISRDKILTVRVYAAYLRPSTVLTPRLVQPYDPREGLGLSWLKGLENGRYFHEEYIAHLGMDENSMADGLLYQTLFSSELRIEDLVAMVTGVRILMFRIKKLKVDWDLAFEGMIMAFVCDVVKR